MTGTGFTTTLTVNADPTQPPGVPVGVRLYTAVAALAVVLVRLVVKVRLPAPDTPPVILEPEGAAHA